MGKCDKMISGLERDTLIALGVVVFYLISLPYRFPFIHILGVIMDMYLPGSMFMRVLYPKKGISELERILFSIGTSICLIPLLGLLLNLSAWGINSLTVLYSSVGLIILLCLLSWVRYLTTS